MSGLHSQDDVVASASPVLTVVIPAFNEAETIADTLARVGAAAALVDGDVEVIVVDNRSTDSTAEIAQAAGARVISESQTGISYARNAGGYAAAGDSIVFIDADTIFTLNALKHVARAMSDTSCVGGAPKGRYQRASRLSVRLYLGFWHLLGAALNMVQGGFQVCRTDVFRGLDGYDTSQYMGEDVDFIWRLRRYARQHELSTALPMDFEVTQSVRRFDQWPLWRTLIWSNPTFIQLFRHRKSTWRPWYEEPPRGK